MKKRWSSALIASLLLFLLNWGVWTYAVVVEGRWYLTPIGTELSALTTAGQLKMARLTAALISLFLVVITIRIYLYMLLMEQDDKIQNVLFSCARPWVLNLELWTRAAAVIAVNFIYYSSTRTQGDFRIALVMTTLLVFFWDLLMVRRLLQVDSLRGVFQRDFFLVVCALIYLFLEGYQVSTAYTPVPFVAFAAVGVGIFWSEMTSTYWGGIRRVCAARSFTGSNDEAGG